MKNPLVRIPLFITPDSLEHLVDITESMTNRSEAYRVMVMTMNYCHQQVQAELDREEARQEELSVMRDAVAPRKDRRQLELF